MYELTKLIEKKNEKKEENNMLAKRQSYVRLSQAG